MRYSENTAQANIEDLLSRCKSSRHYVTHNEITGWVISFYWVKGSVLVGKKHILSDTGEILGYDTHNGVIIVQTFIFGYTIIAIWNRKNAASFHIFFQQAMMEKKTNKFVWETTLLVLCYSPMHGGL